MSSLHLTILAGLCSIAAVICTVFATRAASRESQEDRKHDRDTVLSAIDQSKFELMKKRESLRDRLWSDYPFGYVLFGSQGGNIVSMPFYDGNLFTEASWEKTKFTLSKDRKLVRVSIPQPKWKSSNINVVVRETAQFDAPFETGSTTPAGLVYVGGQPQMHFEVIDTNPRSPIFVIGFREPDSPPNLKE